jgi:hypothetical protein
MARFQKQLTGPGMTLTCLLLHSAFGTLHFAFSPLKSSQFSLDDHWGRLSRYHVPQRIRGIISAHSIFIGVHLQHIFRPSRVMLQRRCNEITSVAKQVAVNEKLDTWATPRDIARSERLLAEVREKQKQR